VRHHPNLRVANYLEIAGEEGGISGRYVIPIRHGVVLQVIASDGLGWEHVSVTVLTPTRPKRCPTWEEMERVRELFWRDDETVMQLSVPRAEHVNTHPYCLHLWKPLDSEIPRPPSILVGI